VSPFSDDRYEMLAAKRTDRRDIGDANLPVFRLDALVRKGVADAPGIRTRPPSLVTDALVCDGSSALSSRTFSAPVAIDKRGARRL
jgi:hypothetical protein